jgi:hypothetical protein
MTAERPTAGRGTVQPFLLSPPIDLGHEIAARGCPEDAETVLAAVVWALEKAMRWRANGVGHLRTCLESNVNALPRACSDDCQRAQIALVWARTHLAAHAPARRPAAGIGRTG